MSSLFDRWPRGFDARPEARTGMLQILSQHYNLLIGCQQTLFVVPNPYDVRLLVEKTAAQPGGGKAAG